MGIEPTSPGNNPGILSQLNYGVIRWASGAADTGLRKRDSNPHRQTFLGGSLTVSNHPFFWSDNLRTSAHLDSQMVRATGFAPAQSASQAEMLTVTSRPC